jgi:hypothetical protein
MIPDSQLYEAERDARMFIKDFPMRAQVLEPTFTLQLIAELRELRQRVAHYPNCLPSYELMRKELLWSRKMLSRAKAEMQTVLADWKLTQLEEFIKDLEAGPGKDKV